KGLVLAAAAGFRRVEARKLSVEEGPSFLRRALGVALSVVTGIPSHWVGSRRRVEKTLETPELVFYLDLVFRDPWRRLRVDAQDFDFSCLGSLKVYDVFGNVRSLTAEMTRLAPHAALNQGAQVFLGDKPVRLTGHAGLPDLDRECRWRLTLAALGLRA